EQSRLPEARLIFRFHAVQRMFQRGISVRDVRAALATGETIETYSDDAPYPSRLVLGWVGGGARALHVVVADNVAANEVIIVTVYEPDLVTWQPGFRRRRSQ